MTKPHDERFQTPPAIGAVDPGAYPEGMKPGEDGFMEALAKKAGFKIYNTTKTQE